ncbi:histidinol-phosphate transaminase [Clostridium aestuarii]|uniref:Histidinol-phosphate aminotransferase n=1 Tax=Clostridium aestuarii TaxID=338193 RepID=A0ABT4CV87_9CLOT|nr:histidinol-phosphate transaminase [Clostridium aestuarii]MCY6482881.1 histidinol-phosphate transaminase [Clostridium aestuarii]
MKYIRDDLKDFTPYLVEKKKYDIRLDANESFLKYNNEILQKMCTALLKTDFNRYPDADASKVCNLYLDYLGIKDVSIIAGNGSDELIQIIANTFLNNNDKVMMLDPDFSMYGVYTKLAKGNIIKFPLDDNFNINVDTLINEINKNNVKILFLSTPNNPTGNITKQDDLLKIINNSNCIVVVDEAYVEFYGESIVNEINNYDNLIILRTLSKAVGLAAIRLGFLLTNNELYKQIYKAKPPFNVNSITQNLATVVLENKDIIQENINIILKEKEFLYSGLKKINDIKIYKSYSNFFLIECDNASYINNLLETNGIKVRYFGKGRLKNYLRINVGSREENISLLNVLSR